MPSKAERRARPIQIKELIATVSHEYWAGAIHKIECKRCKLDAEMKEIENGDYIQLGERR